MSKLSVALGVLVALVFATGEAVSKPVSAGVVASICADNPTKSSGGGHIGCTACSHYGCTDYDCDDKTGKCKAESLQEYKRGGVKTPGSKVPTSGVQTTKIGPSGSKSVATPGGSNQQPVGSEGHK